MKKKFIAVYALIGVLALGSTTLTSCVDDNESASVTAIRDAKAQSLQALANYNNAQAEAAKIVAQAEAALTNAKAAIKKAEAEKDSLQNEKLKATIEIDIQTAVAKAEAGLAAQQAILAQAKAELEKVSNAVDLATKAKIENLQEAIEAVMHGGEYKTYELGDVYYDGFGNPVVNAKEGKVTVTDKLSLLGKNEDGLRYQLIEKKANKTGAELDLKSTQRKIAEYVRKEQEKMATNQALLAEYQKYSNTDRDAAKKAADEADAKVAGLQEAEEQATALYYEEAAKIDQANTNLIATEVETFFADNTDYDVNGNNCVITREAPKGEEIVVTYDDGTSTVVTPDYTSYDTYTKSEDAEGNVTYTPTEQTVKAQIIVNEEALADLVTEKARDLDVANENLKTAQETHTNGLKDEASVNVTIDEGEDNGETWSGTYKQLKDAVAEATKAWNEDKADSGLRETMEKLEAVEKQYIADLDKDLEEAEEDVTDAEIEKANVDALNTMLTGEAFKTYTSVYEALVKAVDASMEKNIEKMKAEHNTTVQETLAATLGNIAAGYTDWTAEINKIQENIEINEKNIALMTDNGTANGGDTEASKQAYIDALDAEIAKIEKEISIKEAQYENFMQQIEDLINESDDTTAPAPETPSEGEETPAE